MLGALKRKFVYGFFWSVTGRMGYVVVGAVTNILLARILGPQVFGQIGVVMFFMVVAKAVMESGLSGALVRKQQVTASHYSTVFLFNLAMSIILFGGVLLLARPLAMFYEDPLLENLLIVTSVVLIINALQITAQVKLIRGLNYKKKGGIELVAATLASATGIVLALNFDAGVWSVVAVQLLTALFITVQMWLFVGVPEANKFSMNQFKMLYKFGINTTLATLVNRAFENVYQLILAKYFAIKQAGFFYQGKKIQDVPVNIIRSSVLGVVFSAMARLQDDKNTFQRIYHKLLSLFAAAAGILCLMTILYAREIMLLLYGQQWLGAVFYLQILMASTFFFLLELLNRIIFKVFDRTGKILALEFLNKGVLSLTIVGGIIMGSVKILLYGYLFTSGISYVVTYFNARKVLGIQSNYEIFMAGKVLGTALICGVFHWQIVRVIPADIIYSILLLPLTGALYFILLYFFNVTNIFKDIGEIKGIIKSSGVNQNASPPLAGKKED